MTFREEVAAFLESVCPASMRTPIVQDRDEPWGGSKATWSPDAKLWLDRMAERGYTAPRWPREYGGAGLSAEDAKILDAELLRVGCRPPLKSLGIWLLAPALLEFGSEEQKREHLPKMARGEIRWCQGYSEPGAGSDLASLSTRARLDGDEYVVDGQKVWTSQANSADWIFCLVRTDPSAPKRDGIGFLLIDMATPGVSVRPIRLISGSSVFCETFFDGVRVPARNMVGAPNQGWTIAKAVLAHERALISRMRDRSSDEDEKLEDLARRYGVDEDPAFAHRIAQVEMDAMAFRLTLRRSAAQRSPGAETSIFKLYGTELTKRKKELAVEISGTQGLGWEGPGFEDDELRRTRLWLRSRASSIEGGTSEIQLDVIAKRVLGLPSGSGE